MSPATHSEMIGSTTGATLTWYSNERLLASSKDSYRLVLNMVQERPLLADLRHRSRHQANLITLTRPPLPMAWAMGWGAPVRWRGAQGVRPRAQRASWSDWRQLSERSGRSPRSEFCRGPLSRAPQRTPCAARGSAPKPPRPMAQALGPPTTPRAKPDLRTPRPARRCRRAPSRRQPPIPSWPAAP